MRLFPPETGRSFRAWQCQLDLLIALERLAKMRPVTTVALGLGFASPSAFIAAFRAALGVVPAQYLKVLEEG